MYDHTRYVMLKMCNLLAINYNPPWGGFHFHFVFKVVNIYLYIGGGGGMHYLLKTIIILLLGIVTLVGKL